jgi:hypothetical protein
MNRAETSRVAATSLSADTVATDLDGGSRADSKPMLDPPAVSSFGRELPIQAAGSCCRVLP